jgi:hypothetical protein
MRNLLLIGLAGLMLLAVSCGGGGSAVTPTHDLTGLEGIWDITLNIDGMMKTPEGDYEYHDTQSGNWIIDATHVKNGNGDNLVWAYDGNILVVSMNYSSSDYDFDCGDIMTTGTIKSIIHIQPGQTSSSVNGQMQLTISTDYCGNGYANCSLTGNFSKH